MTARIDEIATDLYRICLYVPDFDLQFNHFLVRDDQPLLFHTGMRGMFPGVREAVAKLIDPAELRWISWSHFEVDECGALNEWLAVAPQATPVCGETGAMINIADFSNRPPRGLKPDEVLETGRHRFRFVPTPHLPHGWDAGVLFEETERVLLCSDLMHQRALSIDVLLSCSIEARRGTIRPHTFRPTMRRRDRPRGERQ